MRNVTAIPVVVVVVVSSLIITTGCSSKPPADVDAAVRQRLTRLAQAWEQGEAAGVRASLYAADAPEAELADAIAALAPARATLRSAYRESLGPLQRVLFGDGEATDLIVGARQWESGLVSAADPYELVYDKPFVLARLDEKDDRGEALRLRNVDGDWKVETSSLVAGEDVAQLAWAARRQIRHAQDMIEAVRSRDTSRIQQVMIRQLVEIRRDRPARQVLEDVVAAPPAPTAPSPRGAEENPP